MWRYTPFRLNHVLPNVLAYSYADVNEFVAKPHGRLLKGPEGHALYKKTTDEVLEISATLDDTKKVSKYSMYKCCVLEKFTFGILVM